jgi:hypothetical protein
MRATLTKVGIGLLENRKAANVLSISAGDATAGCNTIRHQQESSGTLRRPRRRKS